MRTPQGRRLRSAARSLPVRRLPGRNLRCRAALKSARSTPEAAFRGGPVRGGPDVELAFSILWLIVVAWLIARAWRQQGAVRSLLPLGSSAAAGGIAVIRPARAEARNLARRPAGLSRA